MNVSESPERIWTTGNGQSGSWNNEPVSNRRIDLGEVEYVRSDLAMQWNYNMDEAPRDGTEIIGFDGERVEAYSWYDTEDDDGHIGWCVSGYSYGGILYDLHNVPIRDPIAWMPLPEPPK